MTKAMKAEIKTFVENLKGTNFRDPSWIADWVSDGESCPMCIKEAYEIMDTWKAEGKAIPNGLTPYYLATTWNQVIGA